MQKINDVCEICIDVTVLFHQHSSVKLPRKQQHSFIAITVTAL